MPCGMHVSLTVLLTIALLLPITVAVVQSIDTLVEQDAVFSPERPSFLTRSHALLDFNKTVRIDYRSPALFAWKFEQSADAPRQMMRLVVQSANPKSVDAVAVIQAQFDEKDMLEVPYQSNTTVLGPGYFFGTVRRQATLLLFAHDLSEGPHTLYIKLSLLSASTAKAVFVLTLEEIVVSSDSVVLGLVVASSFAAVVVVLAIVVLGLAAYRSDMPFVQSTFQSIATLMPKGSSFWFSVTMSVWKYFSMALVYFVPAALGVASMFLHYQAGHQDLCTYNNLCLNPVGGFPVYNNLLSNFVGLLLGVVVLIVAVGEFDESNRKCPACIENRQEHCGHYQLTLLLGCGMIWMAIMSSIYHICPHVNTYQFDVTFIVNVCWIFIVFFHSKLRPDSFPNIFNITSVYATMALYGVYCFCYLVISRKMFGVLSLMLLVYLTFYFLSAALGALAGFGPFTREHRWDLLEYGGMFAIYWGMVLYSFLRTIDLLNCLLASLGLSALWQCLLYVYFKYTTRQRLGRRANAFLALFVIVGLISIWVFKCSPSKKQELPWVSREFNSRCVLVGVFDVHDLWHMLGAAGLFFAILFGLFVDDDLRTDSRSCGRFEFAED